MYKIYIANRALKTLFADLNVKLSFIKIGCSTKLHVPLVLTESVPSPSMIIQPLSLSNQIKQWYLEIAATLENTISQSSARPNNILSSSVFWNEYYDLTLVGPSISVTSREVAETCNYNLSSPMLIIDLWGKLVGYSIFEKVPLLGTQSIIE